LKKNNFRHLFSKKKTTQEHLPSKNVKKVLLVIFTIALLLYIEYKPYNNSPHAASGIVESIFNLYQFIVNQTLGIVHEGGHGVCYILPCPKFFMVINGTLFQWAFPLFIAYYYKKHGNIMAFYIGLFILGISMDYTAWYMSTAHEGAFLPAHKSFLGVDALHDFHYIFTTLGVLGYESLISGITKVLGHLLMIGSVIGMFFETLANTNSNNKQRK
jgi:hypothetical protein